MANEILSKSGLFFDELHKIRVVNPQSAQTSQELKEESSEFVTSRNIQEVMILSLTLIVPRNRSISKSS